MELRHPELVPLIATGLAVELTHLRFILLTKWSCRTCHETHLECTCRSGWMKRFL